MHLRHIVPALAAAAFLFGGIIAFAQGGSPPAGWSAADCQSCHAKAVGPAFQKSKHARDPQSCASCHTNVAEHMKAQMGGARTADTPAFRKMTARQINDSCLKCHEKGGQLSYGTSKHSRMNVACTSCHSVHEYQSAKALLKTRTDAGTCYTCHKTERAKMLRTSHHPVREGKMECSSCHNAHEGNRPKMLVADSVNEVCYKCHAEKRGPFLFEHAPVREECTSCHEPHGSNHNGLLAQKMPTLCYNCHLSGGGHFGLNDKYGTQKAGVPVAPTGAPSGYPTVTGRWTERSCMNCHVSIHGSNSPQGAFFVR